MTPYDAWLQAPYDDNLPEPTKLHYAEALDELVRDSRLLASFIDIEQPDFTTPFQLFHLYGGLPSMDGSERDDNLRESWKVTMDNFFAHYKEWLGQRLTDKAYEIMQAAAQMSRDDADEMAAEFEA